MKRRNLFIFLSVLLALTFLFTACKPAAVEEPAAEEPVAEEPAAEEPAEEGSMQIPEVVDGKFNVAMVLIGPHDDGGWSQAHYEGLQYLQGNMENVHTAYIENVPEGADAEQIFRALSRKGFDLIFGTSFGYMDPMEMVAEEYPDIMYIHVSGIKSNMTNFGNLMGAMEDMKFLAGMISGSRAKMDGETKLGYTATFPIPEELRLGNAFAIGMKKTCPECTMDVRWINTWHDPIIEKDAAKSMFDSGVYIVFTGADTPAPADVATEMGDKWGITYDWEGSCTAARCLTAPYWLWGTVYTDIAERVQAGTYEPGWDYFDADTGALGIYGLMEGQEMTEGMKDLPEEDMAMIKEILDKMLKGEFTRFDVFAGPIYDNQGNLVVPEGEKLEQLDLDAFPEYDLGCKYCMKWWAEGITAELPE
ncbi:MAG: BMP family ABC transporter substrate-binding protein [Anaerolineaceae bacterium]|nr:BMP family ABC transporter substrate-binding protein [Anaerolineaceae bacterium]